MQPKRREKEEEEEFTSVRGILELAHRNIQVYNVKIYMVKTDLALMSVAFSNCNWSSSNVTLESWSHNKIILSAYRKLLINYFIEKQTKNTAYLKNK